MFDTKTKFLKKMVERSIALLVHLRDDDDEEFMNFLDDNQEFFTSHSLPNDALENEFEDESALLPKLRASLPEVPLVADIILAERDPQLLREMYYAFHQRWRFNERDIFKPKIYDKGVERISLAGLALRSSNAVGYLEVFHEFYPESLDCPSFTNALWKVLYNTFDPYERNFLWSILYDILVFLRDQKLLKPNVFYYCEHLMRTGNQSWLNDWYFALSEFIVTWVRNEPNILPEIEQHLVRPYCVDKNVQSLWFSLTDAELRDIAKAQKRLSQGVENNIVALVLSVISDETTIRHRYLKFVPVPPRAKK